MKEEKKENVEKQTENGDHRTSDESASDVHEKKPKTKTNESAEKPGKRRQQQREMQRKKCVFVLEYYKQTVERVEFSGIPSSFSYGVETVGALGRSDAGK